MNKKDVLELRRRFQKDCSISRIAGCYVDANKLKVVTFNENFLNLDEDVFFKYLEIAKKTLGGTIGNNILELEFPGEEEEPGGRQQFFNGLKSTDLKNEDLCDRLFDLIIENYDYTGNYLILAYHDSYDIMSRTNDNIKLDESEEVYDYMLVSICPVELSKPGLSYLSDQNRIGSRLRDWVVGAPELGFLFPAFDDHSSNVHRVDYFIRDPKDSHAEFAEGVLGCGAKRTATEKRNTFHSIVKKAYGANGEKAEEAFVEIQESLNAMLEPECEDEEILSAPIVIDEKVMDEVLAESKIEEQQAGVIKKVVLEEFADEMPTVENLVDTKLIKANEPIKEKKELVREVGRLKKELEEVRSGAKTADETADEEVSAAEPAAFANEDEIIYRVKSEMAELVRTEQVDGRECIVIPVEACLGLKD